MKKSIGILMCLLWTYTLQAQYVVSNIAPELREGAQAVVVRHEKVFLVESPSKATEKVKQTITILKPEADYQAVLRLPYNEAFDEKILKVEGTVYNALGKEVKKIKKNDIKDLSYFDGFSLANGYRYKQVSLQYGSYPYTVVLEYQKSTRNLMFYPSWYPQQYEKNAVQYSSFEVIIPTALQPLRYKQQQMQGEPLISETNKQMSYKWVKENIRAIPRRENYTESWQLLRPAVYTAPNRFEVNGLEGSIASWEDMGHWQNVLNAKRDSLPAATYNKVQEIAAMYTQDNEALVKALYEYMQSKTRYVSIQLGIGGWQPFAASEVDRLGYGDCKALSNYMKALLKVANIPAHYAIIGAGDLEEQVPVNADFAAKHYFNHVILCVPLAKDTMWLECTSQRQVPGYMSDFTNERYALLVTPQGGKLVQTPRYGNKDNTCKRKAVIEIDAKGNAVATVNTAYTALQQDDEQRAQMVNATTEEQKKWLNTQFRLQSFQIDSFSLTRTNTKIPTVYEKVSIKINNLASKSGNRLFLQPNIFNVHNFIPEENQERKSDFWVKGYEFTDSDTLYFKIPNDYHVEAQGERVEIDNEFGSYTSFVELRQGEILYIRRFMLKKGRFSKEKYKDWVDFHKKIYKADKMRIVLVSNT